MMPQCQPGMPFDGESSGHDRHDYAMWDAAYVLGSLSRTDRLQFEAHMRGCVSCREAVAELTGMPALLSQLDQNQMAAINQGAAASAPTRAPEVFASLLAKVAWRRHRTRLIVGTATAAAAIVLLLCMFVTDAAHSPTFVPVPAQVSVPIPISSRSDTTARVQDLSRACDAYPDRLAVVMYSSVANSRAAHGQARPSCR